MVKQKYKETCAGDAIWLLTMRCAEASSELWFCAPVMTQRNWASDLNTYVGRNRGK